MKSFDEVAKALSICGRHPDCKGCPYENVSYPTEIGNTCKDIMHYDALYYMQDRSAECQEANSPLTLDELKTMLGQPVWLVYDWNNVHYKGWILLDHLEGIFIIDAKDEWALSEVNLEKWQAYRKERK